MPYLLLCIVLVVVYPIGKNNNRNASKNFDYEYHALRVTDTAIRLFSLIGRRKNGKKWKKGKSNFCQIKQ